MLSMHPATLMVRVWLLCWLAFLVLPFQLVSTTLTLYGLAVFLLFLAAFCAGTALVAVPGDALATRAMPRLDSSQADLWLEIAALIAIVFYLIDVQQKNIFDLAATYLQRSDAADALLRGAQSNSSIAFQIAFLFYPAGYVYVANQIIFHEKIQAVRLVFFGFFLPLLASLSMGGRGPLFYSIAVGLVALGARRRYFGPPAPRPAADRKTWARRLALIGIALGLAGAVTYFSVVFLVRAEAAGGAPFMFAVAERTWGIGFHGPLSELLFALLGDTATFLLFVSAWYPVQGIVMSNVIFSQYDGPAQLGVYGVDLATAIMRRVDGPAVGAGFDSLMQLGTYGFLPTAFGSLYVDFYFFGLFFAGLWGYLAAIVCRHIRLAEDARWLLAGPFVVLGIVFSFDNTPIGFSNGLITHFWLLIAFLQLRKRAAPSFDFQQEPSVAI